MNREANVKRQETYRRETDPGKGSDFLGLGFCTTLCGAFGVGSDTQLKAGLGVFCVNVYPIRAESCQGKGREGVGQCSLIRNLTQMQIPSFADRPLN